MLVPETPMNQNDGSIFGKDDIGLSGESGPTKTKTESLPVKTFSDDNFRLCVSGPDATHHSASGGFVDYICHGTLCRKDSFRNSGFF